MATTELFTRVLGLEEPWFVKSISFDEKNHRLELEVNFKKGSRFPCPTCQKEHCSVKDTRTRRWRHLNFFQYETYITARVPRTECPSCGIKQVPVPWAREKGGFTLYFEIFILELAKHMAIKPLAEIARLHPTSVWRILEHYVEKAHTEQDLSSLSSVGIDECSSKRGHNYITTFGDLDEARIVYVADTRKKETIKKFASYLKSRGVSPDQITTICTDMWPAYLEGLDEHFGESEITFDRFHVMKYANDALDTVRREETKKRYHELKKTRYIWLKNPENLTIKQKMKFDLLRQMNLKTGRAYAIKESLRALWTIKTREEAERYLKRWYFWATHSRLAPIVEFAYLVKNHWNGILGFFNSAITNGIIEGLNSKIKTAMKRAYGFKLFKTLRTIIYLVAGKLALPTRV